MDNEFELEPTPALPLQYLTRQASPWRGIVRIMCIIGAVYGALVVLRAASFLALYTITVRTSGMFRPVMVMPVLSELLPALDGLLLLVGCLLSLRFERGGRTAVLAGVITAVTIDAISFAIAAATSANMSFRSGSYSFRQYLLVQNLLSALFLSLHHMLIPALLWIVLRKREVRELFS